MSIVIKVYKDISEKFLEKIIIENYTIYKNNNYRCVRNLTFSGSVKMGVKIAAQS